MTNVMRKAERPVFIAIYLSYFIAGCGFLFADSPALNDFIGPAYFPWALLIWLGGLFLVIGAVAKNEALEVCGTLPTATAVLIYGLAVLTNPPYGQWALGVAGSGLLAANFWWLVRRFIHVYPNLGKNDRRRG